MQKSRKFIFRLREDTTQKVLSPESEIPQRVEDRLQSLITSGNQLDSITVAE